MREEEKALASASVVPLRRYNLLSHVYVINYAVCFIEFFLLPRTSNRSEPSSSSSHFISMEGHARMPLLATGSFNWRRLVSETLWHSKPFGFSDAAIERQLHDSHCRRSPTLSQFQFSTRFACLLINLALGASSCCHSNSPELAAITEKAFTAALLSSE